MLQNASRMIDRVYEMNYDNISVVPIKHTNKHSVCELDIVNSVIESGQVTN